MTSFLVCGDISDPKRLRRVVKAREHYGYRRQYSVFLCRVSATDFVRPKGRPDDLIDRDEDQVLFIPVCPKCADNLESLGRPTAATDVHDVVVV